MDMMELRRKIISGVNAKELEYIEGVPRQQIIETDIDINNISNLTIDFSFLYSYTGNRVNYVPFFASYKDEGSNSTRLITATYQYGVYFSVQSRAGVSGSASISADSRHDCQLYRRTSDNKIVLKVDNNESTYNFQDGNEQTNAFYLLSTSSITSDYSSNYKVRFYKFKIYSGETLLHDLRPYNISGEIGMLDIVRHKFFKNIGIGSFTGHT